MYFKLNFIKLLSKQGKASMRSFMESYTKKEYVELAAHGYTMLADVVESGRAYDIDCPALLLCGEKDRAGDVKVFAASSSNSIFPMCSKTPSALSSMY